eukprot:1276246-Rhodomonas_salina.2
MEAEESEQNAARSLDCKIMIMPTLIGKLQMAEGDETLAELKLWHSASIPWGELYEENPLKFSFEQLKVGVAQGLSHFEPEPVDAEDVNDFVAHAYAAGTQVQCNTNPNIVCWNCNCIGHPKALCSCLLTFYTNSNCGFGRGFRGVRGVRGVGGGGGVYGGR